MPTQMLLPWSYFDIMQLWVLSTLLCFLRVFGIFMKWCIHIRKFQRRILNQIFKYHEDATWLVNYASKLVKKYVFLAHTCHEFLST